MVFSKTTTCSSYVPPWLVAIGGWRLVEIAGWRLVVGGVWRQLAVGDGWLAAVGGPLGRSIRAVLNKKKIWSLKDHPGGGGVIMYRMKLIKDKQYQKQMQCTVCQVVVGLQESHLLWYGLELGSDPPSPLWYHRLVVGVENGHRFSAETLWFSAVGSFR